MAVKIHAPLDNTHSPFKRMAQVGPGPKGRKIKAADKYICAGGKDRGLLHKQLCVVIDGPGKGRTFMVKTKKATKDKYNKLYAKERKRAAASNTYRAGFKLRSTAEMTDAGKASRVKPGRRAPIAIRLKK